VRDCDTVFSVKWRLADRYIVSQMLTYFSLSLLLFTLVLFFSDAFLNFLREVQRYGLPPLKALDLLMLQMPGAIALAMPASLFLGVLLTFNTLNNTFELIAMRVNGISLRRLVWPVLLLGIVVTVANWWLIESVIPHCNQRSDQLKLALVSAGTLPENRQNVTIMDYDDQHRLRKMIYVGATEAKRFRDTTFIDLTRPELLQIVQASNGELEGEQWIFREANAYTISKKSNLLAYNHVGTLTKNNLFGPTQSMEKLKKKVNLASLNFSGLWTKITTMQANGEAIPTKFYMRLWEKLTLPLSCLAIALAAVPLAIVPPRQGSERGFVFSLLVLFGFYVVRSISVAIGQAGWLTQWPFLSEKSAMMWACLFPVLAIFTLAWVMLQRKTKVL
jgi:lipopolysaccharide export system permease protein